MRSRVTALPTIAALLFLAVGSSSAQISLDALRRAHIEHQLYVHNDFVTPLILKEMSREIHATPHPDYDTLIKHAADARQEFLRSRQYAETGKLDNPFDADRAVSAWAKDAAKVTKNPIVNGLAEAADLSVRAADGINSAITSLDGDKAMLLTDSLRRSAHNHLRETLADIQREAASNRPAKEAFNVVLNTAIGVTLDDTYDDMVLKSPALIDVLGKSKSEPSISSAELDKFIRDCWANINLADADLTTSLGGSGATSPPQQQSEYYHNVTDVKVYAAQSALYLLSNLMPDQIAAQRVQLVTESLVRGYDAIKRYSDAINVFHGAASAWASVALLSSEVSVVLSIASTFMPSSDSSQAILQELNALKEMMVKLFDYVHARLDNIEDLMDIYQRANMSALNAILVQGAITGDRIEQIRKELFRTSQVLEDILSAVNRLPLEQKNDDFLKLQHRCYGDRLQGLDEQVISQQTFSDCIREFAQFALETSESPLLLKTPTPTTLASRDFLENPTSPVWLKVLGAASLQEHSLFADNLNISNTAVWSNASLSIVQTIQTWPKYRPTVTERRLDSLIERGDDLQAAIKSLFIKKGDCTGKGPCVSVSDEILSTLQKQHRDLLVAVGAKFLKVADLYSQTALHGIDPFRYYLQIDDTYTLPENSEEAFLSQFPDHISKCDADRDKFPRLIFPKDIPKRVARDYKIAALLDPSKYGLHACYRLSLTDAHYYQGQMFVGANSYLQVATPRLEIALDSASNTGWLFAEDMEPMFFGATNTPPTGEWKLAAIVGPDQTMKEFPKDIQSPHFPDDISEWWSKHAEKFADDSTNEAARYGDSLQEALKTNADEDDFVRSTMVNEAVNIYNTEFREEVTKSGDLVSALRQLDSNKAQLVAYVALGAPESVFRDPQLAKILFDNSVLPDSRVLTAALGTELKPQPAAPGGNFSEDLSSPIIELMFLAVFREFDNKPKYTLQNKSDEFASKVFHDLESSDSFPEGNPLISDTLLMLRGLKRDLNDTQKTRRSPDSAPPQMKH
jgi:hypothetical protein